MVLRATFHHFSCQIYSFLQSLSWIYISIWLLFPSQVKLHFAKDALRLIARKAMAKNTGARGLRSLLESILMEAMYEVWIHFGFLGPFAYALALCDKNHLFMVKTNSRVLVSLSLDLYLLNLSFPWDSRRIRTTSRLSSQVLLT